MTNLTADRIKAARPMVVQFYSFLWELFCEGKDIDMFDVQEAFQRFGMVDVEEATEDDCDTGFEGDIRDPIFKQSKELKLELESLELAEQKTVAVPDKETQEVLSQYNRIGEKDSYGDVYDAEWFLKCHWETIRAALLSQRQPDGWMDISTAPKDGTKILVYANDSAYCNNDLQVNKTICVASYRKDAGLIDFRGWPLTTHDLVTHWMPLPEAPTAKETE